MKGLRILVILLVVLGVGGHTTSASARGWEIDKAHSGFYFSVGHIFSKVQGHFNDFSGEVKFDPNNPGESSFSFEVKTASVDTNIAKRDKHLQSSDFFDSGKHPLMTFKSTEVKSVGDNAFEVKGKFTVKGVAYDLVLPLALAGVKDHPAVKGKEVIGFNGRLTIDRLAYNIGNGKFADMGVVSKDVDILVTIEALGSK
ncbi:MAG: YceI family protein [Desulforhopalus sp.]